MLCNKWVWLKKIIEKFDTEGYYFDTKIDNIQIFFLNDFFGKLIPCVVQKKTKLQITCTFNYLGGKKKEKEKKKK